MTENQHRIDRRKAERGQTSSGFRHVIPDRFPVGMYFDPYMGDGTGALRVEPSEMKLVDEVDESMAHGLAWSFVSPELAAERERSRKLAGLLDEAIARAETAEAKLAAVHRAIADMHAEAQVKADAHSALTDYWAGVEEGLDRAADAVRMVLDGPDEPPAWQRKPITHEWAISEDQGTGALSAWTGWQIGEELPGNEVALSRPIEPTKGSERGDA